MNEYFSYSFAMFSDSISHLSATTASPSSTYQLWAIFSSSSRSVSGNILAHPL